MIDQAPLTMKPEDVRQWWSRIELARKRRKQEADIWQKLLKNYLPGDDGSINSNIHFRNVETKKAQLFFQLPEVQITALPLAADAIDPQTGQPVDPMAVAAAKRELLNKLLGRDYANVLRTIDAALFDVLATSGIAATQIYYRCDLQPTPQMVPGPDQPNVGSVLGLDAVPTQVPQVVDVPVYEEWCWERFSANALLIPHDWTSTEYDKAPWLGREFCLPLPTAIREFKLPADFQPNASRNDLVIDPDAKRTEGVAELVKGVVVWLRAAEFDPTVVHSQRYRELVLIEGADKETRYRDSPYQSLDSRGQLTPDSMIGNPIHPLVLRDLSDRAWVPSDSAFTDPLVKQENTWAQQDLERRDSNIPRFVYAESLKEAIDKLKDAQTGQGAGIPDDRLAMGIDKLIAPLPHLEQSQSDVEGRAHIRRAIDETLAVSANQAGTVNNTVRSATEVATVQRNASVRLQKEQARVLEWFLTGISKKFDPLVMRYGDPDTLAPIIGMQAASLVLAWKALAGRNAFEVKADSQLSADAAEERKTFLDYQNFNAKNPYIDQLELSRIGATKHGYDASKLVKPPPPPPEPKPEPPKISLALTDASLAIPEVRMLLTHLGIPLDPVPSPEAMAAHLASQKPPEHGGSADKVDPISKHSSEITGQMPGRVPQGAPRASVPVGVN